MTSKLSPPEAFDLGHIHLRRPQVADAPSLFAFDSDFEVARYMDWPLSASIGPVIERVRRRAESWEAGSEFNWLITQSANNEAVGSISCFVDRHIAEVGFLVARNHWGKGYASQAGLAILDWALSQPTIWRVWATCDCENLASARVLDKMGLVGEGCSCREKPNFMGLLTT